MQNVIVIAATSRPDLVDSSILRSGRIEKLLYIKPPTEMERKQIFSVHTKNMPLHEEVKLDSLASQTENYTGADIFAICRQSAWLALREDKHVSAISLKHFMNALEKVGPSLSRDVINFYENFEKSHKNNSLIKELTTQGSKYDFQ